MKNTEIGPLEPEILVITERNTGENDEDFVKRHFVNRQVDAMNRKWRERIEGGDK